MNIKIIGLIALGVGALVTFAAFGQDTAPDGTHNLGLLQAQMMLLHVGLALGVGGGITLSIGAALSRFEQAGLLPPAGVLPTLGTSQTGNEG